MIEPVTLMGWKRSNCKNKVLLQKGPEDQLGLLMQGENLVNVA